MIDINKKYKTRSGKEVNIDKIKFGLIFGEIREQTGLDDCIWDLNGKYIHGGFVESPLDLIEEE